MEKRVQFDFEIDFSNGGGIQGQDFRLDIPGDDISEEDLGRYIVRDLRLLMVREVRITRKRIIREAHKRAAATAFVDLSHTIHDGLLTYKGLPAFTDLEGIVVRSDYRADLAVSRAVFEGLDVSGKAVLVNTGWAERWATDAYFEPNPFLTEDAAIYLRDHGARLVGIDSHNIDDIRGGSRPVHSTLLGAEILIVEHLCNLESVPEHGFTFSAIPPKFEGVGTFPVRAFARLT